jgi:hypothetical protein
MGKFEIQKIYRLSNNTQIENCDCFWETNKKMVYLVKPFECDETDEIIPIVHQCYYFTSLIVCLLLRKFIACIS